MNTSQLAKRLSEHLTFNIPPKKLHLIHDCVAVVFFFSRLIKKRQRHHHYFWTVGILEGNPFWVWRYLFPPWNLLVLFKQKYFVFRKNAQIKFDCRKKIDATGQSYKMQLSLSSVLRSRLDFNRLRERKKSAPAPMAFKNPYVEYSYNSFL